MQICSAPWDDGQHAGCTTKGLIFVKVKVDEGEENVEVMVVMVVV